MSDEKKTDDGLECMRSVIALANCIPGAARRADEAHARMLGTQAEADTAPLTHALDAAGNALCPYDPATLAYVSPRPERVTCPACIERAQATAEPAPREPSAPNDADELARLLPDLPHRIAYARQAARDEEPLDVAIRELADGAELLLAERDRVSAALQALRARVAELEAREHLTAPSPLDLAAAEVLASPLSEHAVIEINGADDAIEVIGELHAEREADTDRSLLLSIARVALAGMLACDAKGGPK